MQNLGKKEGKILLRRPGLNGKTRFKGTLGEV
jgi:hypothetical protein